MCVVCYVLCAVCLVCYVLCVMGLSAGVVAALAVALAVALLGERFGVFGKFEFCAVGEFDFVAAAFA